MQIAQQAPEADTASPAHRFWAAAETWGVHPIVAGPVIATVAWLANGDQISSRALLRILQTFGLAFLIPAYLLQRFRFDRSDARMALAKALIVALSFSAPLLGVWLMAPLGLMGALVLRRRRAEQSDGTEGRN